MMSTALQENVLNLVDNQKSVLITNPQSEIKPIEDFEELDLPHEILNPLQRLRICRPTLLQKYVISYMINSHMDLKVHGMNGTGKMLAYLLPIVIDCLNCPGCVTPEPSAIIVSSSRLLAGQIFNFLKQLLIEANNVKYTLTVGEQKLTGNINALKEGCDIIICTLGRLNHLVSTKEISLSRLKTFVVDEADLTLDITPEYEGIMAVVKNMRDKGANFRTVLLSATFEINHRFYNLLRREYTAIDIGIKNAALPFVKQNFIFIDREADKIRQFIKCIPYFLKRGQLIVFAKLDITAQILFEHLIKHCTLGSLIFPHQQDNESNLKHVIDGTAEFLVTTAICSRGINFPHVRTLVNYDMPTAEFDYIHRLGRCVHQGTNAQIFTFFSRETDHGKAQFLVDAMRDAGQEPLYELEEIAGTVVYFDKDS